MSLDISNCMFPYKDYSESLLDEKFPLVIEDRNGNGVPNPKYKSGWCWVGEEFATMLLNSGEIDNPWKRDFEKDRRPHEMWDLINSDNITIEVKTTTSETEFRRKSARLNNPKQYLSVILKLLIGDSGFESAKFVYKLGERNWVDISDKLDEFRDY